MIHIEKGEATADGDKLELMSEFVVVAMLLMLGKYQFKVKDLKRLLKIANKHKNNPEIVLDIRKGEEK